MSDARLWLAGITVLPALVIAASYFRIEVERLRRLAVASAAVMLLATLVIFFPPPLGAPPFGTLPLSGLQEGELSLEAAGRPPFFCLFQPVPRVSPVAL